MKINILNKPKWLILLITILVISCLSGCGTINRGKSKKTTYRGVDVIWQATRPSPSWGYMGLKPFVYAFLAIDLPIDFVFDTILYPIDKTIELVKKRRERKEREEYLKNFQELKTVAVNLTTRASSVTYKFPPLYYYPFTSTYQYKTLGLPKLHSTDYKVEMKWRETASENTFMYNSYEKGSKEWQEFHDKYGEGDLYFKKKIAFPYYNEDTQLLISVFLPCHQVMLFTSNESQLTDKLLASLPYQEYYKQLKKLEESKQCPAFNLLSIDEW